MELNFSCICHNEQHPNNKKIFNSQQLMVAIKNATISVTTATRQDTFAIN